MIRTQGLYRNFGAKRVLRDLNLEIAQGERVALLGPNGSGKTTLLRILSGLTAPSAGDAWIDGVSINERPAQAKTRLGFVPATDGGFFPRFTGRENLEFFAGLRGLSSHACANTLGQLTSLAPLGPALNTPFHAASSGMRQCLGLARALLGDPAVLLLDEPTRSLDPETTSEFRHFLASALSGITVFFVTHSSEEATTCASRTVLIATEGDS